MFRQLARRAAICFGVLVPILVGIAATAHAQTIGVTPGGRPVVVFAQGQAPGELDQRRADQLRGEFRELMRQYPPALATVLRLDAALMANPDYLKSYPALATFLEAHPEIPRYPEYFLGFAGGNWNEPLDQASQLRRDAMNAQRRLFEGLTIIAAISAVAVGVVWLVRLFVGHRRWIRATRLQAELNNRLLERMGSNDQLLIYLQSQAGQQLMAPPGMHDAAAPVVAPLNRILWAVQAGLVLICAGVGLLVIRRSVVAEAGEMLLTFGVLAVSIGVGFALASGASYLLSRRFGLLDTPRVSADDDGRV